ncbi:trypsin-1-like [Amphibalanus amphitrite]|uniref:trypsin-1-like n=1 Tax=Amphibalanus amphitrite TaxID=1232801 RepID=UPI001C91B3A5|nr:trypsin-1-like [Amphibalanus amphitrite]
MFRLAVVTCVVLATGLAKPPPPAKADGGPIEPLDVEPVAFQEGGRGNEDPEPVPFLAKESRATYTLPSGRYYFTSPNYPNQYPNNHDSSFTVKGDNNQDITINCSPFSMESHSSCAYDYLSINERKYCGSSAPPATTVSELRIRIYTDYSVTATGFYCLVTIAAGSGTTTTSAPPSGDCQCGLRQTRVVGGADATAGQFPWQAGLVSTGSTRSWCGGSVINNRYVLTAAHCTENSSPSQIQVMLGDLRIGTSDSGEQRFSVQQIIQHPQYTSASGSGWDFSLLKLDREISFSNTISPVCLPTAGQTYADVTAIASGYGRVGATEPQATHLQHVTVPVWSQSRCQGTWGSTIKSSMICAGGYPEGGRSVCMGDSGGPLVTEVSGRFRLIGVVSFGRPCAVANWPDVYGRVTEALSWIATNTADANTCTP